MSALFTPFELKSVVLKNRVVVAPMCQFKAINGYATDWHDIHYAGLARGGAGLVIVEATAVAPEGRITPQCLGIWNDEQGERLARIARLIKDGGSVPGIQIGHAGIKASISAPWDGEKSLADDDPDGWPTIGPSFDSKAPGQKKPTHAMTTEDIARVQQNFVDAAVRARDAGFQWLELHFAHCFLAQSFFSRHTNHRTDRYGGDFAGRSRFMRETFAAVRQVWPKNLPLTIRFGVIEFDDEDEQNLGEGIELLNQLKNDGLDFIDMSMGFSSAKAQIPWGPKLMLTTAEQVRKATGLATGSAWGMDKAQDGEEAIASGKLDLVMIGTEFLGNPHYTYQLAKQLSLSDPSGIFPKNSVYSFWMNHH